ncbi:MAG: type II toxin-antitoxin system MqsA family antitoxin, partial [Proteobacteria bacterium]|nr:type II toxin-antitoxin system MqsA family antitoxin [Pseudomonadota bacterium]
NTCPVCEMGKMHLRNQKLEFEYKDDVLKIEREVLECEACQETFFQDKDEREIEKVLTDRRREVDNLLTSDEIRAIRKKFNMTQKEFAKTLRVSEKSFARYECVQSTQGYAMDNLLRILNELPLAVNILSHINGEKNIYASSKPLA